MKIIPPITITDAILTSSTVPENDYAAWNSGTSYVIGDYVILTTGYHKIYQALTNNINKNPATNPTDWDEIGATNRWKMFDSMAQSPTIGATPVVIELAPGTVANSIAVINTDATSANVTVTDPVAGEVFNQSVAMEDYSDIDGYYSWFFSPLAFKTDFALTGLPAYPNATIKLTLTRPSGNIIIGEVVIGRHRSFGVTGPATWGTSIGTEDYSSKTTDEATGQVTITKRRNAKTVDYRTTIYTSRANGMKRLLNQYLSIPIVLIGEESMPETIIYGFYQDWGITLDNYKTSTMTLSAEELA